MKKTIKKKLGPSKENGRWYVDIEKDNNGISRAYVVSDDFTHDVSLLVRGNFGSLAERNRYAKMIARRLTR
jgi:hypothetical protein